MKKSKRMALIRRLAVQTEKKQAVLLGQAQQKLNREHLQLEQLEQYLSSYNDQTENWSHTHISSQTLQEFSSFIVQLKHAIGEQNKNIGLVRQHLNAQKKRWIDSNNKVKIIDKYIEKLVKNETRLESRQEQQMIEDLISNYGSQGWK
ncbi:MAG: flagellar export protein FliJ [Gammaproteobacteria bacterium]|nr:MAG: flagellar export protein FliJ [Gammaproteobacteria bacterium]